MADVVDLEVAMRPSDGPRDRDVAELAGRQHGIVAHAQLVDLGLGKSAIQRRVRAGRLHRIHMGVYAVGHRVVSRHGRWLAAVLACGPDAVLSHHSAAALWGLRRGDRARTDVTAPGRSRAGGPGITLHSPRRFHQEDRTTHEGIPVTSIARTLLDLAEVLPPQDLERAFEEAERRDLLDLRAITELAKRSHGRRALRPLTALLVDLTSAPPTRSELERRFLDLVRDAGLPMPEINGVVEGLEVDFVWRRERLAVELDSRTYHQTRAAFERDRIRDAKLQLAGYRVLRITHRRLAREAAAMAHTVRSLLRG